MFMNDDDNNGPITKSIKKAIGIIIAVSLLCPLVLDHSLFNPQLKNSEWSSFLGSYLGGIIGGIGTLLAVYFTTKQTWKIQNITTNQLKNDKDDKERKERITFSNDIAVLISEFLADMDVFVPDLTIQKVRILSHSALIGERNNICKQIGKIKNMPHNSTNEASLKTEEEKLNELDQKIADSNKEIFENERDRLVATKCYYLLKIKLNYIGQAGVLLEQLKVTYNSINSNGEYRRESKKLLEMTKQFIDVYLDTPCS